MRGFSGPRSQGSVVPDPGVLLPLLYDAFIKHKQTFKGWFDTCNKKLLSVKSCRYLDKLYILTDSLWRKRVIPWKSDFWAFYGFRTMLLWKLETLQKLLLLKLFFTWVIKTRNYFFCGLCFLIFSLNKR